MHILTGNVFKMLARLTRKRSFVLHLPDDKTAHATLDPNDLSQRLDLFQKAQRLSGCESPRLKTNKGLLLDLCNPSGWSELRDGTDIYITESFSSDDDANNDVPASAAVPPPARRHRRARDEAGAAHTGAGRPAAETRCAAAKSRPRDFERVAEVKRELFMDYGKLSPDERRAEALARFAESDLSPEKFKVLGYKAQVFI